MVTPSISNRVKPSQARSLFYKAVFISITRQGRRAAPLQSTDPLLYLCVFKVCYSKRKSPYPEQGFFGVGVAYILIAPHRTCSARRSLKCPAVWVWPAFSLCRLCCCRLWPWRKNRQRSLHKMQPAQPPLNSTKKNSPPATNTRHSLSTRRLKPAPAMTARTADSLHKVFPTQSVTAFICD